MRLRRPRRSLVVLAGAAPTSDDQGRALVEALGGLGIETTYLGWEDSAQRIAAAAVEQRADAVELCLAGARGVLLLRELLRELIRVGRRDVSIVVHRPQACPARSSPAPGHAGDNGGDSASIHE
jgi:methylmalonyl-CoA mutase cobalamin-binding subunit